jgi:hypothetical protein
MADDPKPGAAMDDLELDDELDPEAESDSADPDAEPPELDPEADPDAEPPEPEADSDAEPPAKPISRAARRIQSLTQTQAELRRELDDLKRRQGSPQPVSAAEQARMAEERRQRLALMDPDQRTDFLLAEQQQQFSGAIRQTQLQGADMADQSKFDRMCDRKPHFDAIRDEVETLLAQSRQNGQNPTRESLAYYLIGKRADERAARARGKQTRRADVQRQRQTVQPRGGRGSDVAAPGRDNGSRNALQKRIDGYDADGQI